MQQLNLKVLLKYQLGAQALRKRVGWQQGRSLLALLGIHPAWRICCIPQQEGLRFVCVCVMSRVARIKEVLGQDGFLEG
jgi:hypothetical protein